jgi:TolB-like protein
MSFFAELKRRNVVRVGIAYVVVAWLILQFSDLVLENISAPDWVMQAIMLILAIGLPLALFFAWAFELTPEGLKTTKEIDRSQSVTHNTGRKLDRVIIGVLVIAVGYFLWERQQTAELAPPASDAVAQTGAPNTSEPGDPAATESTRRSIAVLPFVNMSSDQEQEWFSDGLTEEVLNALARTPDLLVAARTSSFKFKDSVEDIPTIAKSLGVAHILEGSVRSGGDQLRVTAQLIRASDGFHLWSQTYDRNPEDVIAIQEEIAISIATALETAMDPQALERMVSSGTNSVAAYNAYLQGLAYGASTLSTGDTYTFLGARDSFERAIELDPDFSLAYWELAGFWQIQLSETNIVAGIVEMPREEMEERFNEAIDKAIATERDPVNVIRYRVLRAMKNMQLTQALRLNTEYLEQRPNDQDAQNRQLNLLVDQSLDDELMTAINEYQERDGYDTIVVQASMTYILVSNDKEAIRTFANTALERVGDSAFVMYQAHRALLWAGDIDGASGLSRLIQSSDLPESSRLMVRLRQACAENRLADAIQLHDQVKMNYADETSLIWISNRIMGNDQNAFEVLKALDDHEDLSAMGDYLSYAYFDARPFPNLMALLKAQGIEPRQPLEIPYRCKI